MSRREQWRRVLEGEIEQWKAKPYDKLISELRDVTSYGVKIGPAMFQVEVEILETTNEYVHVMVAVDDGSIPYSFSPETGTFICCKEG